MEYDYNDYELIYLIKEDSEEAIELIMAKYEPIIKSLASYYVGKFSHLRIDYEDLLQEGRLGLIQAIRMFNDAKNVLFYTFAILCIKSKIINSIKHSHTKKNYPLLSAFSTDDSIMMIEDKKSNIEEQIILEEFQEKIINFKNELNDTDAMIFELKLNSFSYREISILLDIDFKKVDNRLCLIRKKLKKYLLTS